MKKRFGQMPDGTQVEEVVLQKGTLCCSILTYGGAVRTLTVPDRQGRLTDVVLGIDTLEDYRRQDKYLGALVGRYANPVSYTHLSTNRQDSAAAHNRLPRCFIVGSPF